MQVSAPEADAAASGASAASPSGERSAHGDVSRTWELELLISGAVVFALLQLPSVVDGVYQRLDPHLTRGPGTVLLVVYWYFKAILYALIACFLLHLAARGYWVGLIGLDSVFPQGVRWENLRYGPITRQVYAERLRTLPSLIARTDNLCSVIFSFAFAVVLLFLVSVGFSAVAGGVVYLLSGIAGDARSTLFLFYGIMAVIALPPMLLSLIDRRLGDRIDPASREGRLLRVMAGAVYRMNLVGVYGPILFTLFSNFRKRVIYPLFYVVFLGLLLTVFVEVFVREGVLSLNSYEYLPAEPGAHGVQYGFYESQRPEGEVFRRMPSIQSDVVRDPFVKLFIPYAPERHNRALARCPGVRPLQPKGVRFDLQRRRGTDDADAAAVLRCLAQLHRVTLNGGRLADPGFAFYTHPRTGLRGVIAYIPTAGLPRGRNVLTVQPAPPSRPRPRSPPPEPYVIPFWL